MPTYLIATYGTFGVMGASLFGTAGGTGLGSRPGMAAGEARQSHAAVRLLRGEGDHQHGFQRASSCWRCSPWESRSAECACRLPISRGSWVRWLLGSLPFSAMGLALGYFAGPNSAPSDDQPDLFAHVVLQRTVGAVHVPAQDGAARSRWCCRLITCRNWRSESWALDRMSRAAAHWEVRWRSP